MEDAFFGGVAILETETQRASIKLLDTKGLHFLLLVSSILTSIYFEEYPYPLMQSVTIVF